MVNRIAVKVPPFWAERPELWFSQIEAQFEVSAIITDATKYNTVVAAIESNVLAQIADAILHPPAVDKYGNLKRCIIERFSESEHVKIQKLISDVDLGDRRPIQLLSELRVLAENKVTDEWLKSLWLQRLPPQARAILQVSNADLNELAKLADKVIEVGGYNKIAAVAVANSAEDDICMRLSRLEKRFDDLLRPEGGNVRRRSLNRRSSRAPSPDGEVCWFHRVFGNRARKCRQPCMYSADLKN